MAHWCRLIVLSSLLVLVACELPTTQPVLDTAAQMASAPGDGVDGVPGIDPVPLGPFMPFPDGFQFKNFGGAADWELFEDIFGGTVHTWSITDVTYYEDSFVPLFGGGQCYGFAVAAGMFYRDVFGPHPSFFQRGAEIPWHIPQNTRGGGALSLDEGIERHISKYWYFWYSAPARAARTKRLRPEQAEVILDLVQDEFLAGWSDPWVLEFFGPWGGHAVNIVRLERLDAEAIFTVYDNNAPFKPGLDTGLREFRWTPDEWIYGSRQVDVAAITPVSPHEVESMEKWWGDPSFAGEYVWVSLAPDPDVFVLHTDILGRRLGRTSTAQFYEIEGADELIVPTGLPEGGMPPIHYFLTPGAYTVDLSSLESGDLDYRLFAGDALLSLEAYGPGPTAGQVSALIDEKGFAFEAQEPIDALKLQVVRVVSAEEERAITVSGIPLAAEGWLQVTPTTDVGGFNIDFRGGEATALSDISLTHASPAGILTTPLPEVQLQQGALTALEPWDWDRLVEMPVFVRSHLPGGVVLLQAYNATTSNLADLLRDMVDSGAIPNRGIANSLFKQARKGPSKALQNHLRGLVAGRRITLETAEIIFATVEGISNADEK